MERTYKIIGVILLCLLSISIVSFAELYKRAPDALPGTLPEMRNPSYWIEKMENPDEVILTAEDIQSMNEEYIQKIQEWANGLKSQLKDELEVHSWKCYDTDYGHGREKVIKEILGEIE